MSAIQHYLHQIHDTLIQAHLFRIAGKIAQVLFIVCNVCVNRFVKCFVVQFCSIFEAITNGTFAVVNA